MDDASVHLDKGLKHVYLFLQVHKYTFDQFRPNWSNFQARLQAYRASVERELTWHSITQLVGSLAKSSLEIHPNSAGSTPWYSSQSTVRSGRTACRSRARSRSRACSPDRYNAGRVGSKLAQIGVLCVLAQADGRVPRQCYAGAAGGSEQVADLGQDIRYTSTIGHAKHSRPLLEYPVRFAHASPSAVKSQYEFQSTRLAHGDAPLQAPPQHTVSAYCVRFPICVSRDALQLVHGRHTPSL